MDFKLTEEHLMIQQAARDFAQTELFPGVIERDEHSKFPTEQVKMMGELGFMGMMVDPQYGGAGLDSLSYVLAMEEIAKVDASAAVIMSVNNSLVCAGLEKYGSEEQKIKYLTPLAKGEVIGAFCLSEPEAGSDATSQRTTASTYLVMAQSDAAKGHKGINVLIVEKGMPGFEVGPKEKKMGIRGSDTHTLLFNDVKVPNENRFGADGFGFAFAMSTLNGGRIGIASQALGIAQGAYELALKYSQERVAFGKPIFNHQAIAFKLADMHVKITCARLLIHKAATEKDNGEDIAHSGAMAKLYASEIALEVANEAVQIHGGNGYVSEYHVERMMRDSKITQIYEGTSEIQRIVISSGLVK